jgi:diamine N-acetyltransferase
MDINNKNDHAGKGRNADAGHVPYLHAPYLHAPRLRLRALEPADVDLLYTWENDPSVWNVSNTLTPFSRFQLEEYVLNAQNDIYATKQLRLIVEMLTDSEEAQPIGTIDLFDFDPVHARAGVGILIREQFRDRGYAAEALDEFIRYAFGILRLHQLYCNISPDNEASLSLFRKSGFVQCGIKKDWINDGDQWQEEWMFQLIRKNE